MNSRELVYQTLNFENPARVPRQLWILPWASNTYPDKLKKIRSDFPDDMTMVPGFNKILPKTQGDPSEPELYTDDWGCKFTNVQRGIIGEMKEPLIKDEEYSDIDALRTPEENIGIDIEKVNEFCRNSDQFIISGACPRPFERLQFIRGTEQLYVDLMLRPAGLYEVMEKMHDYYCRLLTVRADTDVDALMFMDDWGSQRSLLIDPKIWTEIFKPKYKDFIDIAHKKNKKIFMHSDGYIIDILPELIELGLDAINSQIFCNCIQSDMSCCPSESAMEF